MQDLLRFFEPFFIKQYIHRFNSISLITNYNDDTTQKQNFSENEFEYIEIHWNTYIIYIYIL